MLKCDLHIHTTASDGIMPADVLAWRIYKETIDVIGLTDHNTFPSNTYMSKLQRTLKRRCIIILGTEISSSIGHILILGVTRIDKKLLRLKDIRELLEYANEQNYLTIAPHPFDVFRRGVGSAISRISIDAIECINGRTIMPLNMLACYFAKKYSLSKVVGSDAHVPHEVGNAYFLVNAERDIDDILEKIRRGKTIIPLKKHLLSKDITLTPMRHIMYGAILRKTSMGRIIQKTGKTNWLLIGRNITRKVSKQISKLYNIVSFIVGKKIRLIGTKENIYLAAQNEPLINIHILKHEDIQEGLLVDIYINREVPRKIKDPIKNALRMIIYTEKK